jgi:hypothetical protein
MSVKAHFLKPMLCLSVKELPEGPDWEYELKLDGDRTIGVKTENGARIFSRNGKNFSGRFPTLARALEALPDESVAGRVFLFSFAGKAVRKMVNRGGTKIDGPLEPLCLLKILFQPKPGHE